MSIFDGAGMAHRRPLDATAALLMAGLLGACAGGPKAPPPAQLSGSIEAAANLNPSISQRASPVIVRIYELKADAAFNSTDFVAMFQHDQTELSADIVSRQELVLQPGETRPFDKTLAPETRFIGVMAAYRDVEHAQWRSIAAVRPNLKQRLTIRADALRISAAVTPIAAK